jgi:hypothetical protein
LQEGELAQYRLGQYLRERYGEFLGDVYSPDIIVAQSTDLNRTKMSALLALAGLWPSEVPQQWNSDLQHLFAVHSEPLERDSVSTLHHAVKVISLLVFRIRNQPKKNH